MDGTTIDAAKLERDLTLDADVVIVGTGAGGGFTAEVLSQAGLKVVMLEAGGYHLPQSFSQNEGVALPMLYQQAGAQRTKSQGIGVFQGQAVGGTTVVNWTTSFRTPPQTLEHWAREHGVRGTGEAEMRPYFEAVEQRLGIHEWVEMPPNRNNALLAKGCDALGIHHARIQRNVRGCADTGLCGLGCPINAKLSMLVTTSPEALKQGATLVYHARVETLITKGDAATGVNAIALDSRSIAPTGRKLTVNARHVVLAAGAIRTPAVLMRSKAPDPSGLTGKRTFLHPVTASAAVMADAVDGWKGAPQSIYSDAYLWPDDGRIGFKLEVTPLQPAFALVNFDKSFGRAHTALARRFKHLHSQIALMRDGFHPDSAGGTVELQDDGYEVLDYPISGYVRDGFRRSLETMMAIQFAAGAEYVLPWHIDARPLRNLDAARAWLAEASFEETAMQYGSAHVMGGCAMGEDPKTAVVNSHGAHHQLGGLSVFDGSVFPTSIGANPQVSIYAMSLRNAQQLAARLIAVDRSPVRSPTHEVGKAKSAPTTNK